MNPAGAVVVAAGRGERLGGAVPKGVRGLAGRPLVLHAVAAIQRAPSFTAVVAVVPSGYEEMVAGRARQLELDVLKAVIPGGSTRLASVRAGLDAVGDDLPWVAVHDAARPLADAALFEAVLAAAREHGGAIAGARATDTVKLTRGSRIVRTLDRRDIRLAQTPQVFRTAELKAALASCERENRDVTDETQAMERAGGPVAVVEPATPNLKINTEADWRYVEYLLARQQDTAP